MIQRIQSIYLVFQIFLVAGFLLFLPTWPNASSAPTPIADHILLLSVLILSIFLSVWALFSFKKLKLQLSLNRWNILLQWALLGWLIYVFYFSNSSLKIQPNPALLPCLSIVMLVLANKRIQKDQALLKSVDRIR